MNRLVFSQPRPEVVELERLISEAEKSSPQLWAAIRNSISIAEIASCSVSTTDASVSEIYQGAETSAYVSRKERAKW